jgi:cation diffusion facilitator CzcD-associated flavoprotein CzcO
LLFSGALDAGARCLDEVEQGLALTEPANTRWLLARVAAVRCAIACFENDLAQAETYASSALQELPQADHSFRATIHHALGDTYRRNGRWEEARACYLNVLDLAQAPAFRIRSVHVFGALADLELQQGRLRNSAAWRKALAVIQEPDTWGSFPLPLIGWVFIRMGEILYEWNELGQAGDYLSQGLERAELGGDVRAMIAGYLLVGRLKLTEGDSETALDELERARPLVEDAPFPDWVGRFGRLQLECWLAQERLRAAVDWADAMLRGDAREGRTFAADNVVLATGFFQQPKIPPSAAHLSPGIRQHHSSAYRNPESLPAGAVLIVGSAQSGCQIAEELYQRGRQVFLCTGSAGRLPRRYRGQDVIAWLDQIGFFDLTPDQLPPGMSKFEGIPHISGVNGGHTLNLHRFARDGVTLLGYLRDVAHDKVALALDLHKNLAKIDQFEREVLKAIDDYIQASGIDPPLEDLPQLRDGYEQPIIEELDLKASGVTTLIWAIGYTFDYSLVRLPVCDDDGFPIQTSGVTSYAGLYFVGMPWMPSERSGFLIGVSEAAQRIASNIAKADGYR